MDAANFRRGIDASYRLISMRLNLSRSVSSLNSLGVDPRFNEIALASDSTYKEIYLRALSLSYYNILMEDYSILQFSFSAPNSWRLAYLPNPWISGVSTAEQKIRDWEEMEEAGIYDENEVSQLISELPYHAAVPPLRFEYASAQYKEISHPAAHLHIGRHAENRWPMSRALSPLAFTLIVMKMYYPLAWGKHSSYHGGAEPCIDTLLMEELVRCGRVHDFSDADSRSIHLNSR